MSRGRLLLVDDEDDIRLIARMSLERVGGWEVVAAASADEAVAAVRTAPVDAVLLDVMMPGSDGPATLERLRPLIGLETPVIFLTAKTQAGDRRYLEGLGAAGLIAKPFDPMRLADEVAERLRGPADPPR